MSSVFSARKLKTGAAPAAASGKQAAIPLQTTTELTRSSRYRVSQLVSAPGVLRLNDGSLLQSHIHHASGYAVAVTADTVAVWKYVSNDSVPEVATFSYAPNDYGIPARAVLTPNLPGSSHPGLVIIDSVSGKVRYHESVVSAPAVGFLNSKELDLRLGKEYVDQAEFVDNFTILLSTSSKRVVLLNLADGAGRPCLSKTEIQGSQRSFFGAMFEHPYRIDNYVNSSRMVALRAGKQINVGLRELFIADSDGSLSLFQQGGSSLTPLFSLNIRNELCAFIAEVYPHIRLSFRVEDVQLLRDADGFVVLASFDKEPSTSEKYLVLFTISVDHSGVSVHSSYRLTSYIAHANDLNRLFMPAPFNTAFIASGSAIVMTDVPVSIRSESGRKWEDFVRFRPGVKLVGYGCENETKSSNSACVAVADGTGLLRVELLSRAEDQPEAPVEDTVSLLKSHMEQAIVFGDETEQSPMFFNLSSGLTFLDSDVEEAVSLVVHEILSNTSRYMPSFLPSLEAHLAKRVAALRNLAHFAQANFLHRLSENVKLLILSSIEKITFARAFYESFGNASFGDFIETLELAVKLVTSPKSEDNLLRGFFSGDVSAILSVLSVFVDQLLKSDGLDKTHLDSMATLLDSVINKAFLDTERDIRYSVLDLKTYSKALEFPPIAIESDLFFKIDALLERFGSANAQELQDASNPNSLVAAGLAQSLYYAFNDALQWNAYKQESSSKAHISEKYGSVYTEHFEDWVILAIMAERQESTLLIAEFFKDYRTLCIVLEARRIDLESQLAAASDEEEVTQARLALGQVYDTFEQFLQRFGYDFASQMYEYYISENKLGMAFLEFPRFRNYLSQFLSDGRHGDVSWIRNVLDKQYEQAAATLLSVSQTTGQNYRNKLLQLSIAKLALKASGRKDEVSAEYLRDIAVEVSAVQVQQIIEEELNVFASEDSKRASFWAEEFSTSYLKPNGYSGLLAQFSKYTDIVSQQTVLLVPDLIQMLTLVDQKTEKMENFFYNAFKLVVLLKTEAYGISPRFIELAEQIVWLRLLARVDWKTISDSSDVDIMEEVKKSSLYKTVFQLTRAHLISSVRDSAIVFPLGDDIAKLFVQKLSLEDVRLLITGHPEGEIEDLEAVYRDILAEQTHVELLNSSYNLGEWVKSIAASINST